MGIDVLGKLDESCDSPIVLEWELGVMSEKNTIHLPSNGVIESK